MQAACFRPGTSGCVALATCANFGLTASGDCGGQVAIATPGETVAVDVSTAPTSVAWSHTDVPMLAVTTNSGAVRLYNARDVIERRRKHSHPVRVTELEPHRSDAAAVSTATASPDRIATAGWDGCVHLYSVQSARPLSRCNVAASLKSSAPELHDVVMSNADSTQVLVSSASGHAVVIDTREATPRVATTTSHGSECLSADWDCRNPHCIVSGGADGYVAVWDLRHHAKPLCRLRLHSWGITSARCAPAPLLHAHARDSSHSLFTPTATASFDMTAVVAVYKRIQTSQDSILSALAYKHGIRHREFARCVRWSDDGFTVLSAAWDRTVVVFRPFSVAKRGLARM